VSYDARYFASRESGESKRATTRAQDLERVHRTTGLVRTVGSSQPRHRTQADRSHRLLQDLPGLDPPRNFVVFSGRVLRPCLLNVGFREPAFVYPYLGTPYARPIGDHVGFFLRLRGIRTRFAFWRNMTECYAQK
jgi:hypothetical protein